MSRAAMFEFPRSRSGSVSGIHRGLTVRGVVMFFVGALLMASASEQVREFCSRLVLGRSTGGVLIHPFLFPLAAAFPLLAVARLALVPSRLVLLFLGFAGWYFASTFYGGVGLTEGVKIATSILTVATMALLVTSWEDFVAATTGMCIGVGSLAVLGIVRSEGVGIEIIQAANRNTFSLYGLPVLLLGGYVLARGGRTSLTTRFIITAMLSAVALATMLTLNRSGWLGMAIVAGMLLPQGRKQNIVLLLVAVPACFFYFSEQTRIEGIRDRVISTQVGLESDRLRLELARHSFEIAMEVPLLGVSPQKLPYELARRLGYPGSQLETHNVFAHLAAGSGVPALVLLIAIAVVLWRWKPSIPLNGAERVRFLQSRNLMRMVLVLWAVRGLFSHEILYSPTFCMALGLSLGLCLRFNRMPKGLFGLTGGKSRPLPAAAGRRRRQLRTFTSI